MQKKYNTKLMPLSYKRCFGLLGLVRKIVAQTVGLFRAIPLQVTEADIRTVVLKTRALAVQTFMTNKTKEYERLFHADLHNYLTSIGLVDKHFPEAPDIEERWAKIGESYMPDGIREFNGYPQRPSDG